MEESFGFLEIRAYAANEAIPIENAVVLIEGASEDNSDVYFSYVTDEDGVTRPVSLRTPPPSLSLSQGAAILPYSVYNVTVTKEGFYTKRILGVSVFPGISSILPVNMIPNVGYLNGSSYPQGNNTGIISPTDL